MRTAIIVGVIFSTLLTIQRVSADTRVGISVNLSPYDSYRVYDSHYRYSTFNHPRAYLVHRHDRRYWHRFRHEIENRHPNNRYEHKHCDQHRSYGKHHGDRAERSGRIPHFFSH